MRDLPDIASDAPAPNTAKLVRELAAAAGIRKNFGTAFAEKVGLTDTTQVSRWFTGKRAIGWLENRDRLVAAFPAFEKEIERAIRADKKRKEGRKPGAIYSEPIHAQLDALLEGLSPAQKATIGNTFERVGRLGGWLAVLPRITPVLDSLEKLDAANRGFQEPTKPTTPTWKLGGS